MGTRGAQDSPTTKTDLAQNATGARWGRLLCSVHSCPDHQATSLAPANPRPPGHMPLCNVPVTSGIFCVFPLTLDSDSDKKDPCVSSVAGKAGWTMWLKSGGSCHTPMSQPWDPHGESWVTGTDPQWPGVWSPTGTPTVSESNGGTLSLHLWDQRALN